MKIKKNWEFNVLEIDNYRVDGKLKFYYDFIKKNVEKIEGDILEVGVYRGKTLISTALLLKELGSQKTVYGFDSFQGFPEVYNVNDNLEMFNELYKKKIISKDHYKDHQKLIEIKNNINKIKPNFKNISTSGNFDNTSYDYVKNKIKFLKLDNIKLIKGNFSETMKSNQDYKFMTVLLDCDLYESYYHSLRFAWKNMSIGSMMYLDEYFSLKFPGARIACDEFFLDKIEKPFLISNYENDFERWAVLKK